jgi:hypothetical protein
LLAVSVGFDTKKDALEKIDNCILNLVGKSLLLCDLLPLENTIRFGQLANLSGCKTGRGIRHGSILENELNKAAGMIL